MADGQAAGADGKSKGRKDPTRTFIMAGLALGMLLASLDQTVVGTGLPKIVADLGGLDKFSWLFSAYMLAATVMIPMAGKMSDRYGRRPVFLFGMACFLGGSMLSGIAQDMNQLIIFRFVQGFGGGAMMPVAMATVADLYPPTERGKIQGGLGAVFAISSIIGPFIGGYIVDNLNWRWVFYVNLPVGIAAILVTMVKFPRIETNNAKPIDYLGMAAITASLTAGLLITFWGGDMYAWDSVEIIGLGAACVAASIGFIVAETKAVDPIVPFHLFKNPIYTLCSLAMLLMAVGLFGVVAFLPLFLQAVIGISATYSGEVLIPLMISAMVGSVVSGVLLKRTGYKVWIVSGPMIGATGLYMLSTLHSGSSTSTTVSYLLVTGLGLGFTMANYIVAAQNIIDRKVMGTATSTLTLFRSLGGTIGITVLGVVVNRRMAIELPRNLPPGAIDSLPSTDMSTLGNLLLGPGAGSLPASTIDGIRNALGESITYVFFISTAIVLAAWAVTLFIKSVPLKDRDEYMGNGSTSDAPQKPPVKTE